MHKTKNPRFHELHVYLKETHTKCSGSTECASQERATSACGLFWPEDNRGPKDSRRGLYLPFNCLKEVKGLSPGRELSPEKTTKKVSQVWWAGVRETCLVGALSVPSPQRGRTNICLPNICFPIFLWIVLFASEVPDPFPFSFAQMAWKPFLPDCLWASHYYGAPTNQTCFSPVNLFHVH